MCWRGWRDALVDLLGDHLRGHFLYSRMVPGLSRRATSAAAQPFTPAERKAWLIVFACVAAFYGTIFLTSHH
jgi:hypothetical protein